jgi:hypothetical protein
MEDGCQILDFGGDSRDGLILEFDYFDQTIMRINDGVEFFSNLVDLGIVIEAHVGAEYPKRQPQEVENAGCSTRKDSSDLGSC